MRLPGLKSLKRTSVGQDETVFAEAKELAHLRLAQCIHDLDTAPPATEEAFEPRGIQSLTTRGLQ